MVCLQSQVHNSPLEAVVVSSSQAAQDCHVQCRLLRAAMGCPAELRGPPSYMLETARAYAARLGVFCEKDSPIRAPSRCSSESDINAPQGRPKDSMWSIETHLDVSEEASLRCCMQPHCACCMGRCNRAVY